LFAISIGVVLAVDATEDGDSWGVHSVFFRVAGTRGSMSPGPVASPIGCGSALLFGRGFGRYRTWFYRQPAHFFVRHEPDLERFAPSAFASVPVAGDV